MLTGLLYNRNSISLLLIGGQAAWLCMILCNLDGIFSPHSSFLFCHLVYVLNMFIPRLEIQKSNIATVTFCVLVLHLITKRDSTDDDSMSTPKSGSDYLPRSRSGTYIMADRSKKHKNNVSSSQITVTRSYHIDSELSAPSLSKGETNTEVTAKEM